MARASRAQSYFPVKIPIFTLSGGVGRQIPSKRLPTECDALTNFFCTTQSSLDKRNGTEFVSGIGSLSQLDPSGGLDQVYFSWLTVDAKTSILLVIDTGMAVTYTDYDQPPDGYDPSEPSFTVPANAFRAYKFVETDDLTQEDNIGSVDVTIIPTASLDDYTSNMDWKTYEYLQYGGAYNYGTLNPNPIPARERLETVNIGSSTLILNKEVEAGFTTHKGSLEKIGDPALWRNTEDEYMKRYDGSMYPANEHYSVDFKGADVTYLTASAVDREGKAELWSEYQDYVWNSHVIDTGDPIANNRIGDGPPDGEGRYPYSECRGKYWREIVEPNPGGQLVIDFNNSVPLMQNPDPEDNLQSNYPNKDYGNQITLRGIDPLGGVQSINYIWQTSNMGEQTRTGSWCTDANVNAYFSTKNYLKQMVSEDSGFFGEDAADWVSTDVSTRMLPALPDIAVGYPTHGVSPLYGDNKPGLTTIVNTGKYGHANPMGFISSVAITDAHFYASHRYSNGVTPANNPRPWASGSGDIPVPNGYHNGLGPGWSYVADGGGAMDYILLYDGGLFVYYWLGVKTDSDGAGEAGVNFQAWTEFNQKEVDNNVTNVKHVIVDWYANRWSGMHALAGAINSEVGHRTTGGTVNGVGDDRNLLCAVVTTDLSVCVYQNRAAGTAGTRYNMRFKTNANEYSLDHPDYNATRKIAFNGACLTVEQGNSGSGQQGSWSGALGKEQQIKTVDPTALGTGLTGGGKTDGNERYSEAQKASGFADAAEFARAINLVQNSSLIAYANQKSINDTSEFAGRVIIQQKAQGASTNSRVWINSTVQNLNWYDDGTPITSLNDANAETVADQIAGTSRYIGGTRTWNLQKYTATTIPNSFSGGKIGRSMSDEVDNVWSNGEMDGSDDQQDYFMQFSGTEFYPDDLILGGSPARFGVWKVREYIDTNQLPGPTNALLSDADNPMGSTLPPHQDRERWERVTVAEGDGLARPDGTPRNIEFWLTFNNGDTWELVGDVSFSQFIPVEDYVYPDQNNLYLGQSFKSFSDLKFPPDTTDLVAYNGGQAVQAVLEANYKEDFPPYSEEFPEWYNQRKGKGKIIYLSQAFQQNTPGWYRIIRKDKAPYLKKIRTPGPRTTLDSRRMPQLLYSELDEVGKLNYYGGPVDWEKRENGDAESNRGPGIFFNPSTDDPQESKITAMAYYRDRLFLANEDTIVASRSGDWDNFFIANVDNIIDSDPLDLRISSNNYTPVTHLVPFRDFLFVGTSGNTQYELTGSNNVISPLTAEFAPTAFYPMMPEVSPQSMNNNLFFYSKGQLFIYFGQRDLATEQAFEVSKHVPNYLPDKLHDSEASSYGSMLFGLKMGSTSGLGGPWTPPKIYCYRNQISGEKVVQNAFFDWTTGPIDTSGYGWSADQLVQIHGMRSWGKYLYLIHSTLNLPEFKDVLWVSRLNLSPHNVQTPRLDDMVWSLQNMVKEVEYDVETNLSSIELEIAANPSFINPPVFDCVVTSSGEFVDITRDPLAENYLHYQMIGNYDYEVPNPNDLNNPDGPQTTVPWIDTIRFIGRKFKSSVTLSPIYLRDEANNITPGTLNLRSGIVQTYNSKAFDVEVNVNNRSKKTHNFVFNTADDRWEEDWIGKGYNSGDISERQERFPILGFAEDVRITISSEDPHPLNIASLQFTGKFKPITRYHNS